MLGRVVLYIDVTNLLYRRPARLQFMAGQVVWHCAAASGSGHSPPGCMREAVWGAGTQFLPEKRS